MILKDRMLNASPIWRRIVKRAFGIEDKGVVMAQTVLGAAAGAVTVSKIKANDHLVNVTHIPAATQGEDLTSEFSITADATINNTGGTASTGGVLIVIWEAFDDE